MIFISKLALDCYDWKTKICASTYGNGKGKLRKIGSLPRAPLRLEPALVWAQFRQGLMSSPFDSWTNNQHLLSSLAQLLLGFDVVALLTAEVTPDHQSDWRKKRFNFFDQINSINSKKNMTWNSEFNHASLISVSWLEAELMIKPLKRNCFHCSCRCMCVQHECAACFSFYLYWPITASYAN